MSKNRAVLLKTALLFSLSLLGGVIAWAVELGPVVSSVSSPVSLSTSLATSKRLVALISDREVKAVASLNELPVTPPRPLLTQYAFETSMFVKASIERTKAGMTNYRIYVEKVPFVEKADFNRQKNQLWIEGGVWKYYLRSLVQFTEVSPTVIKYEIILGHFQGLKGEMVFTQISEGLTLGPGKGQVKEPGTLVSFSGGLTSSGQWPPKLIVTKGAEIVFEFTGRRMREFLEDTKKEVNP